MIGRTLAHYEITGLLGRGGMGEVYRATDTKLGRDVALKVLPAELARQPDRLRRFKREAQSVAALSHPNIVVVHSVEDAEGIHFLTMELVNGQTLDRIIPDDGLGLDQFFDLSISLADAVQAAHRKGFIHRDLKPANIMVDDEGRLRVLDFGLSKLLDQGGAEDGATVAVGASGTSEGRILGTAAYMSPEQAEGRSLDHRTDIFSLGIVLYEMATGRRPFQGHTQMSTLSAILREEPLAVTELRHSLPRHLGRIVRRCLRKDPERRYQSAGDIRNDLRDLREEMESGQHDAPIIGNHPRFRGIAWPMVTVATFALLAVLWNVYRVRDAEQTGQQSASQSVPTQILMTSSGLVTSASVSPDGSYVAFVAERDGHASLHVKQCSTGSEVEILPPSEDAIEKATISADGQHVLYLRGKIANASDGSLFRVPLLGGTPHRLIDDVEADFALSLDGRTIAFFRDESESSGVFIAASDGSHEQRLGAINTSVGRPVLAWSPSGESLIVSNSVSNPTGMELLELDVVDGTVVREFAHQWTSISGIHWRRDGRVFVAGQSGNQRFQDSAQLWVQESIDAEPRVLVGGISDFFGVSLVRSGTLLATVSRTRDQMTWVVPAADPERAHRIDYVARIGRWYVSPSWTRDSRILLEHREGENLHIRALTVDGRTSMLLTTEGPFNMGAKASPDGKHLAFFSNRSGSMKIYLAELDGSGARRLTDDAYEEFFPAFSPDGEWVYYHTYDGSIVDWRIRRVRVAGGASELLSDSPAWAPRVSPDGENLLVTVPGWALAILSATGGEPEILALEGVSNGWATTWHPDGESLTTASTDADDASIWIVPLDGSERSKLVTLPRGPIYGLAWNSTGDSLAVVTCQVFGDVVLISGI